MQEKLELPQVRYLIDKRYDNRFWISATDYHNSLIYIQETIFEINTLYPEQLEGLDKLCMRMIAIREEQEKFINKIKRQDDDLK